MQPDAKDAAFLWDMLDAAVSVRQFVDGRQLDDYLRDELLQAAVERKIEIIGEAASKVSAGLRELHPEIPWKSIVGQRIVLAHKYGDVDHQMIWRVATIHVVELIDLLEPLLPSPPDTPG